MERNAVSPYKLRITKPHPKSYSLLGWFCVVAVRAAAAALAAATAVFNGAEAVYQQARTEYEAGQAPAA